jgi:hypothetical protein
VSVTPVSAPLACVGRSRSVKIPGVQHPNRESEPAVLKKIIIVLAVGFAALALPTSAFAAGSGYEGDTGATGVPGTFGSIITTQEVQTSGGTVTGTDGSYSITVTVPSGAFTQAENVTLTSAVTSGIGTGGVSGDSALLGIGINITDPSSGDKVTGTFTPALTVTITGTFSASSDAVVFYDDTTSAWNALTGATITATEVTFSITADPDVAVLGPASASSDSPAVAGATSVTTGKPFRGEEIIAGALVLFGLVALFWVWRRRPSTRRG